MIEVGCYAKEPKFAALENLQQARRELIEDKWNRLSPLQKPFVSRITGRRKREGGDKPLPYKEIRRGGVYPRPFDREYSHEAGLGANVPAASEGVKT